MNNNLCYHEVYLEKQGRFLKQSYARRSSSEDNITWFQRHKSKSSGKHWLKNTDQYSFYSWVSLRHYAVNLTGGQKMRKLDEIPYICHQTQG
jgi:hypothetical protein